MDLGIDLRTLAPTDTSALTAAYAVETAAAQHARPGWIPLGESARVAAWQAADSWDHRFVGAFHDGVLVGMATCSTAHDTPDTSWVNASVVPGLQGRGIGTALVRAAEELSPDLARRFVASAYRATTAETDGLARAFAQPLGYSRATTETVVELDLPGTSLPAPTTPEGYTVATYVGGVPDHLRTQVGVIKGLVDAEAPSGDLAWEPTPVSVQDYADEIALWQRQGATAIESLALTGGDTVAAWTCLVVAADPARPAQVEGTLVLEDHRGRGLGRAVKVASLHRARLTSATRVRTSSDDDNRWMRSINAALGFTPVESEIVLHRQRPDVRGR